MKENIYLVLSKLGWFFFVLFIFLNLVNWAYIVKDEVFIRILPFQLKDGKATGFQDSLLTEILENKPIIKIDTLEVTTLKVDEASNSDGMDLRLFNDDYRALRVNEDDIEVAIQRTIGDKEEIEITYSDSLGISKYIVSTIPIKNYLALVNIGFNAFFLVFIYFNSLLLLKYSQARENIFIVLFLLLLSCPTNISGLPFLSILSMIFSGLVGILFYHFIKEKVSPDKKILKFYILSSILIILCFFLDKPLGGNATYILFFWSIIWIFIGFLILWKSYKATRSIELKRLLNAFRGVFIAIVSLIIILIMALLLGLYYGVNDTQQVSIINIQTGVIVVLILAAFIGFVIGILWFFGSFTWGLLTGTALGVKIRSTMIYTIVGVMFVVFFGLLDYSLGELLQKLFGRFVGSEFIAGIPATIGLLMFFNPVRQRVERLVDNKLNTSDLDFLEKTDTFSEAITGEGVIEGFEEYICENLMQRLPIKKVALISYNMAKKAFIFNEIRGSDVEENSLVEDVHLSLLENKLHRNYGALNENPQEIGSFSIIIPIIYDLDHKWFLALGKKMDGTSYSKKDEEALTKLAAKIKLSLKFILAYEHIINNRYVDSLEEKDNMINRLQKQVAELAVKLNEKNISIEKS